MSSSPARMKTIHSKMKGLEWSQHLSHYKSMDMFFRCSMTANYAVLGLIWPNFEFVLDEMDVPVTCKNKKIRSKMKALE